MKQVIVKGKIKPGRRDEFLEGIHKLSKIVKKESGCLRYEFYFNPLELNDIIIIEHWADEESLNTHLKQDHILEFMQFAYPLFPEGVKMTIYDLKEN
ncbi:MAG TPA: putative quinol monooxygenase [Ignavibacteria bacterium]|nr:putative quinol monooxygenase [Ignavibacteria bacterium]